MHHKFQQKVVNPKKVVDLPPKAIISAPKPKSKVKLEPQPPKPQPKPVRKKSPQRIYGLGDVCDDGRRILMKSIGIDIGTKNIILACKGDDDTAHIQEINGYYIYPNHSKFIENMLNDPNKIRSDGTKRPARWIKFEDRKGIYVLGKDAEELAYAHNDTLLRPMAEGGISQDEDAMMILASIVQGLLQTASLDIGKFDDKVHICYCTTAPAINQSSNIEYHKQVVDLILDGFETDSELSSSSIRESHAIVLKESEEGTGIGISWGAGTVTVSYVKWGDEVYSFCWVGAGDWIDSEVARRHGYDPEKPRKKSSETPTTVCRAKEKIDLSPDDVPAGRLDLDITLHYKLLIQNVIRGIVEGFVDNENEARIDGAIDVYMAGGTASPNGFAKLVENLFDEEDVPFEIDKVIRCDNPLYTVAEGCLAAAEMQ